MEKLTRKQFEQAVFFLKTKARKLDRALFDYEFEKGTKEAVLEVLRPYQNEDGGFGHGLEPDFRCQESSALATSIGLSLLARMDVEDTHDMVIHAVNFLLRTFNKEKRGWQIVPKEVETAPRAIWWNYSEEGRWGNPSAEILGLLHHYNGLVSREFLEELTQNALDYVMNLEEFESHELLCFIRLSERLPEKEHALFLPKIKEMAKACVTVDPSKWDGYCLLPLQVVTAPDSEYLELFDDVIPSNLEHIVKKQNENGYWDPTWSWGQFEAEWEQAKVEWRGSLTLDNLRVLRAFNEIEVGLK